MPAIIYGFSFTFLAVKQHLLPPENNYHSSPLTWLSWLAYTAPFLADDSQGSTDVAFRGNTFHLPLQFETQDFLWLKKAVVNGYCQNKETRGKLMNSQSLKALLYFHTQYNIPKYASKLITIQLQLRCCIQKLRQNSLLVQLIIHCMVFFGKFHWIENVWKSSNSHAHMLLGFDMVAATHFKDAAWWHSLFIFFPFFFFPLLFQVKHIKKLPGHSSIKDAICKTQDMKENKNTEKKNTTKHYTQIKVFCFSAKLKTYILMHF